MRNQDKRVFIVLQILFFYGFAPLQQTASLIQKDKRRKRFHIIKEAHTLAVLFLRVQLCRRIEGQFIQIFQRALALHIKASNGVYLVVPQLHANRVLFCQRININDAAADSKLSRHLHLSDPFISHTNQTQFYRFRLQYAANTDVHDKAS